MELQLEKLQKSKMAKATKLGVNADVFGLEFNEGLVHQVITSYQTAARAGTRATKNRSDVRGGGAKPWRQKGTGRARAGTRTSPIWRGGGHTFPKAPYDYTKANKINKKVYRKALCCILSQHQAQNTLRIIDSLDLKTHKTKDFIELIKPLAAEKALIITDNISDNLELSSRNIPHIYVVSVSEINPVILHQAPLVVMTKAACEYYSENLK